MKANLSRVVRRGVLAAAMTAAFASSAFALPQFTLDPTASSGGLTGATVTADNVIVSNYSTVRLDTGTGSFAESGFLSVQNFQLGGGIVSAGGLNSDYSLYIRFDGTGTQTPGDPSTTFTSGEFDSLEYTLYAVSGTATFGFDGAHNPTISTPSDPTPTALATGSLLEGTVFTTPTGEPFTPGATALVTFTPLPSELGFFASPVPFFSQAFASFVNTSSQVTAFDGGFTITQGGGAYNFAAAPIPEPQTYALMLAGLAAMGFVVRRRSGT